MSDVKPEAIRSMFDHIAPVYDRLNHGLSLGLDVWWRWKAARKLKKHIKRTPGRILDLCCGTGDMTRAVATCGRVTGCDFSTEMLGIAARKLNRYLKRNTITLVNADALSLPFGDASFQGALIAFGLRNLASPANGLRETLRILAPGGILVILEFCPSRRIQYKVMRHYFLRIVPKIGSRLSRDREAYRYLPESVEVFAMPDTLAAIMAHVGLKRVGYCPLLGGVAWLHWGYKPSDEHLAS